MKKIFAWIISLVFLLSLTGTVLADMTNSTDLFVEDVAQILSKEEQRQLSEKAQELTEQYQCAVYIRTLSTLSGKNIESVAEKLHEEEKLGYGNDKSCILLLISLTEREYDIMAHGYGNTVFTDYGKEKMVERFLDEFKSDDWYGGFLEYLYCCKEYFELAKNATPFDAKNEKNPLVGILVGVGLPLLIALIVCSVWKSQMKSVKRQSVAQEYIDAQGLVLTQSQDLFTHTTRIRRKIQKSSGSTSVNRRGSSHRSGKF